MKRTIRKKYFVDKSFQFGFAANMVLLLVLYLLATTLLVSWIYFFVLDDQLVCDLNIQFIAKMVVILICMAIGVLVWAIKFTHGIAGPALKIDKIVRNAAEGKYPERPFAFRKGDSFRFLADNLNSFLMGVKRYNTRTETARGMLIRLKTRLHSGDVSHEECLEEINAISRLMENIDDTDS
jgi:hypothetical protein